MSATTDTSPAAAAAGSGWLTGRLRALLAIVLIADILDLMDSTITNIAALSIVREIGGGESLIKWLGASYALVMGVLLVVGGRLGHRYGKRRMFLTGIVGFTAASLACGLAADPAMLITARLLQGAGVLRRGQRPGLRGVAVLPDGARPQPVPRRHRARPAGLGACFSSLYDVAIGSAMVTTVYFSQRAGHGAGSAMTVSVAVVGAIAAVCLGLVWLLPSAAPAGPGSH